MDSIDQELIPNNQILSFEEFENMECETFLLSVTRGIATNEQKEICYRQYIAESFDRDPTLNEVYFEHKNNFELWYKNELIGLCHNTASLQDWVRFATSNHQPPEEMHEGKLFLMSTLDAVFILKRYRGKELGNYFAGVIRDTQLVNLLGLLAHNKVSAFKHVVAVSFCDYETKGGESFHKELYADFTGSYIEKVVKQLGYSYSGNISAGY